MEELSSGGPEQNPGVRVRREMGRCSGCAFWDAQDRREDIFGLCRRHSPRPVIKTYDEAPKDSVEEFKEQYAWWPTTESAEFCGDYFPIELEVE